MTAEEGFAVDRHAAAGRKSHCKACDRQRRKAYYDLNKDEWNAERRAAREAAWQAELAGRVEGHRKRVAAAKRLHAAQVRRQKEFLRSIGVPDLSAEEITARAQRSNWSARAAERRRPAKPDT
jgi:hypothetical protein